MSNRIVSISICLTFLAFGCSTKTDTAPIRVTSPAQTMPAPTKPVAKIEAAKPEDRAIVGQYIVPDLFELYGANALAIDTKLKGKYIELKGELLHIRQDGSGKYYLGMIVISNNGLLTDAQLSTLSVQEKKWQKEGYPPNVICMVDEGHEKDFANAKVNTEITVSAKVKGLKQTPNVWKGYIVELEKCRPVNLP